ncbi:MAG: Na/Pi cotransporter family protein, partial [Candidatus Methanomethylophilus sp.]|nr:Na/Pi cotransporter family protein [Methanomethylophilus sp.]
TAFHTITDLERVGDYAENIVEYAEKLQTNNESFSESAQEEVMAIVDTVEALYEQIIDAYRNSSEASLEKAYDIEQSVDDITDAMADHHIVRLSEGTCKASVGAEFLSLTSDVERIADHFINMGRTIRDVNENRHIYTVNGH